MTPGTTNSLDPGRVVLVPFPFTNQLTSKVRPALVVSDPSFHSHRLDVVLIAVTSQTAGGLRTGEADIRDWHQAGLLTASRIKPIVFTVEKQLIRRVLGSLSDRDGLAMRRVLITIFGLSLSLAPSPSASQGP